MSALNGHKFIVIGDSYTVGITGGGGTIDSWLDYFVSWYGSEWDGYFESAIGGYGFAKTDFQFINLLNALDNTISDKASITDILVVGGYNDHGYLSGVQAAIAEFKTVANQKYPNAKLWIAPVGWTTNQYQADVITSINYYIQYGNLYGYRVLEEMKDVMRSNPAYLSSDDIHPTEAGYKVLAQYMHTYLLEYLTAPRIMYNGQDKWRIKVTGLLNEGSGGGGGGNVDDVKVNGTSVVDENKVAQIDLSDYATQSYVINALDDYTTTAVLQANYYTKTEVDTALQSMANANSVYTKTEADTLLSAKANASDVYAKSETYSDDEVDALLSDKADTADLATVATSGSYNDLSDKPTIPSGQIQSDWAQSDNTSVDYIKNKPTIPSDTTYTFAEGTTNGAFQVTPSGGSAQSVKVHGLGSMAYAATSSYVAESGDTMTGTLTMNNTQVVVKDNNITSGSNPSSTVWGKGFIMYDSASVNIAHVRVMKYTGGKQGLQVETQRVISGTTYYNSINMLIDTAGEKYIELSDPAAWRSALGLGSMATANTSSYVAKAGDTMTGNLTVSKSGEALIQTRNTQWTLTTSSTNGLSANTSAGAFYHLGSDNTMIGRTNCYGNSAGATNIVLQCYDKTTSGGSVNNQLGLTIAKNGSQTYWVSSAANFRSAIGAAASSSRAYKENIEDITEDEAKKILDVEIKSFDYKEGFGDKGREKGQFGVIAEDVINIIPSVVNIPEYYDEEKVLEAVKNADDDNPMSEPLISVDYFKFIPYMIKMIQMQQREIEELKAEIKAIKEGH